MQCSVMHHYADAYMCAEHHYADAYMCAECTVKGSENASPRMLRLLSRPPCNSPCDEDEDDYEYTWNG